MYKKLITTALTCILLNTAHAEETEVVNRAASIWLNYNDVGAGDLIMQDVFVPSSGLTTTTYYSILNWNAGLEGGGYAGIQDHPNGRNYIFSLWDPRASNDPIVARYQDEDTEVENFGGEGTGLKSWNFSLGWNPDTWYTLVARTWPVNDHTYFGYWTQDQSTGIWTHLVTMDYPVADVNFVSRTSSFVEDWLYSGANVRSAYLSNGHKRFIDGSWIGFSEAEFSVVQHQPKRNYDDNFNASANSSFYTMTTGGATSPDFSISNHTCYKGDGSLADFCGRGPDTPFTRSNTPQTTSKPIIEFAIDSAISSAVNWSVPQTSSPQLKYTITVNGITVNSAFDPEARTAEISVSNGDVVEVTLEDIFGRSASHDITVVSTDVKLNANNFVVSASSAAQAGHKLANAFDGDTSTIWHTRWTGGSAPSHNHDIIIDLGARYDLTKLEYTPRLTGENGTIAGYEVYVSDSTSNFGNAVTTGTWQNNNNVKTASLSSAFGRYVKFVARSEVNDNIWTSAAEVSLYHSGKLDHTRFVVSSSSSVQAGHKLANAFDGDTATMWHTSWSGSSAPSYPHDIIIDLGTQFDVSKLEYTPRLSGQNGTIAGYEVYVSNSANNWGSPVTLGTWATNNEVKTASFTPTNGRYVILRATSEVNGNIWASGAEVSIYQ